MTLLPDALTTEFGFTNKPDSWRGDKLLEERLRGPKRSNEIVMVQSETLTVDDAEFQARVVGLYEQIIALGPEKVESGVNYYQIGLPSFVSADRKTTMMPFVMAGTFDEATKNVEKVLEIVRENNTEGFKALIVGVSSVAFESNEISVKDIEQGERVGVPIALLILLFLFGAVVAAVIPIGLAIISIIVALGATALVGQLFELIFFVTLMITMIGLGSVRNCGAVSANTRRWRRPRATSPRRLTSRAGPRGLCSPSPR